MLICWLPDNVNTLLERALEQGAQVEAVHSEEARTFIKGASTILRFPTTP